MKIDCFGSSLVLNLILLVFVSFTFTDSVAFVSFHTTVSSRRWASSQTSASSAETNDAEEETGIMDWKDIANSVFSGKDQRPVILFDGMCNLCNGGVNFALDYDDVGNFRFVSLQSKTGKALLMRSGKDPDDISSIVLVTSKQAYFKSEAVLRIASKLEGKNPLLPVIGTIGRFAVPSFMRDSIYEIVANNRYRFGEADQCRLEDDRFFDRFIADP